MSHKYKCVIISVQTLKTCQYISSVIKDNLRHYAPLITKKKAQSSVSFFIF